ncbi:TPA: hypothetical protein ACH3X1_011599 [Trebouxia sp. C0004]
MAGVALVLDRSFIGRRVCYVCDAICLAKQPSAAVTALTGGGVFTFSAPLVLSQQSSLHTQQLLADLLPEQYKMAAASISVHHFVNNLDIVPRLLGATSLNMLIEFVVRILPRGSTNNVGAAVHSLVQRAGKFVPVGTYHLIVGASLRSVDATADPKALLLSWQHAVEFLRKIVSKGPTAQHAMYIQWLQDHFVTNYSLGLAAVAIALTTKLPPGQDPGQLQTVLLRSNAPGGNGLRLGVMCNVNGVKTVMQNVFVERKNWKKALVLGSVGAVGLVLGKEEKELEGLMQKAGHFVTHNLGDISKHFGAITSNPTKVVAQAPKAMSGVISAAGTVLQAAGNVVVPLMVTQLAVGLLNLGVTAYVAYRVHALDSKLEAFRTDTSAKLAVLTSGISSIQAALQDQKIMLTASLAAIDGKLDNLLAGQRLILTEVYSLRKDVQTGIESVHQQLLAQRDSQFRQKYAQLEETYCDVLRRMGTLEAGEISPHLAKLLRDRGRDLDRLGTELQHELQSRLDAHSDTNSARALAQRQPLVLAFCFAALARDVGDSLIMSPDRIQMEAFDFRQAAVKKLDIELTAILRPGQCLMVKTLESISGISLWRVMPCPESWVRKLRQKTRVGENFCLHWSQLGVRTNLTSSSSHSSTAKDSS